MCVSMASVHTRLVTLILDQQSGSGRKGVVYSASQCTLRSKWLTMMSGHIMDCSDERGHCSALNACSIIAKHTLVVPCTFALHCSIIAAVTDMKP